ncbi:hypothetical protein H6G76_35575 [Nostoc sp. FACHB-152]|nr:hypothetical protein [Nostoc sp. FACHB-152]
MSFYLAAFEGWRQAYGQIWLKKIIDLIDYDLEFSEQQKELLKKYYKANFNLIDKIEKSGLSDEEKQEISNSLFMPK